MGRQVALFTGQWADMPLEELAKKARSWGYDALELGCWGDHMDVEKATEDENYVKQQLEILHKNNLTCCSLSNHLAGQLVCDLNNDARSDDFASPKVAGDPEKKREWAIEQLKLTAKAARNVGVEVVNGFTGSSIWHLFYSFPPLRPGMIEEGFKDFADKWNPILDVFAENGIKFALEPHPTEIAYDIVTAEKALEAVDYRPEFGFNFDPSHFHWQLFDPVEFIRAFPERIYNVHMKDAAVTLDGRNSILGSHLDFGDSRRGWDFRSLGRGGVEFEEIIRALNNIQYDGPLAVEWEDSGMDREHGASEAANFVRQVDFPPSNIKFDAQFDSD